MIESRLRGSAEDHAATVVRARQAFVMDVTMNFPRESLGNVTRYVDYLITHSYLSNEFYNSYANMIDDE